MKIQISKNYLEKYIIDNSLLLPLVGLIAALLIALLSFVVLYIIIIYSFGISNEAEIIVYSFIVLMILSVIGIFHLKNILGKMIYGDEADKIIQYTNILSRFYTRDIDFIQDIGEIEKYVNLAYKSISKLIWLGNIENSIFNKRKDEKISDFLMERNDIIKKVLLDLKKDLLVRLQEQKLFLENTQEISADMLSGSHQGKNIIKLQVNRLDIQIKQFEELRKILVKM